MNINLKTKKMKKLLLLSLTLMSYIAFSQCVDPVISDFECSSPSHAFGAPGPTTITNPVSGGINTSANVGEFTDDGLSAWDNLFIDFGAPIDLSTNSVLHIKIYTTALTAPIPLLAKLEGGTEMEIWGSIDVNGAWKEYTFDFSAAAGNGNTKVALFFNGGETTGTASDIYYIDDLLFDAPVVPPVPCADPVISNFECTAPSHPFGGNGATTITNPVSGGINTSANVGEFTDNGADAWDNLEVDYGTPIDLSVNNLLKIKIHTTALTAPIPLLAKLEGGTQMEIWGSIDVTGDWKEYTFDFSAAAGNGNTKVVLFFNGGETTGAASDVYYIDDFLFTSPPCADPVISNFECSAPSHSFGGNGATTIANPVSGSINTSANVGEFTDNGADAWDNLEVDFGAPIDLSVDNKLRVKIYTTALTAPIPLLAKLEGGTEMEIWGSVDVNGAWKEYEFDFSAAAGNGNTKVVLFFNGGEITGTASDIYYIDDLFFTSATLSTTDVALDNAIKVFPNPANDKINVSSKVNIDAYELVDITGKTIIQKKSKTFGASFTIDISVLNSGLYFLNVNSNKSNKVIKILKE